MYLPLPMDILVESDRWNTPRWVPGVAGVAGDDGSRPRSGWGWRLFMSHVQCEDTGAELTTIGHTCALTLFKQWQHLTDEARKRVLSHWDNCNTSMQCLLSIMITGGAGVKSQSWICQYTVLGWLMFITMMPHTDMAQVLHIGVRTHLLLFKQSKQLICRFKAPL